MLGIDLKAARIAWTVFFIGLALLLAYLARHTLLIFVLSLFFAYMLAPVVAFLARWIPARVSPQIALALVYVGFLAALIGAGAGIGSVIAAQAANLSETLPALLRSADPLAAIPFPSWLEPLHARTLELIRTQVATLDEQALPILKRAVEAVAVRLGGVLEFILVPILAFFFLKDGPAIKDALVDWTTEGSNSVLLDEILSDVHILLGHYIRILVILSAITFTVYTLFLQLTGASYAALLGGIAAILEFIPVVGPLTASVILFIVLGVTGYPHLLAVIVFLILFRMFQDYVLAPYLMGGGVELHPLLVLFGVLAGQQIAGIPGMFLSVPVIAVLRVVYIHLRKARARRLQPIIES